MFSMLEPAFSLLEKKKKLGSPNHDLPFVTKTQSIDTKNT